MAAPPASRLDGNQVLKASFDEDTGRLRTTSESTVVNADIEVELSPDEDGVHIGDKNSGNTATVDVAGNLAVKDQDAIDKLTDIETELNAQTLILSDIETAVSGPQPLPTGAATEAKQDVGNTSLASINTKLDDLNVLTSGTIDGTPAGTQYVTVNNLRQQILASHDRIQSITYADFGTKDQRITQIDYNSSTFSGFTARKTITYTLLSGKYRRDSINWSII